MTSHTHRRNNRRVRPLHQLEPLELRALFSAVIGITANANSITSGDITPSVTDFTNFGYMSTTASVAIGKLTHTFTINNTGDGTLSLTGAPLVKITGSNASDFSVQTLPATSITAGTQNATTFVIAFTPHGTGTRKATVTIVSNDTGTPSFTFAIQGTGIKTTNFTTGLQIATTTIGTGTDKSIPGTQLTVDFSEYLMDHTLIDTSDPNVNPGRTPFEFNLGIGQVIPGWDQGLIGLKKNESRILFIPSDLAYGEDGLGAVPPNTPLIFTITDVDLVQPLVAISGNDVNIVFNDTSPSTIDGTLIGTTVAGDTTPIDFIFKLTNAGQGSIFYPVNNIVITGKNASAFTTSLLSADTTGTFANFTITYHPPANAGTQNAVVNIITNDPLHPNFKFNIAGVNTPFQDLTAVIATANYAAPIITGSTTTYKVPVKVTNHGNLAVPKATAPLTFDVYLHNGTNDTLIYTTTSTALRNLGVNKTSTVNLSFPIPITVATGTYEFLVKVNDNHTLAETDYADNDSLSPQFLSMTQGFYDLVATIGSTNFPANAPIISGALTTYKVPVTVTNAGNLKIPSNAAPISLRVYLHNSTGGADTLLISPTTTSLRNLSIGGVYKTTLNVQVPITAPSADFQFLFKLNETATLTESSLANNIPLSSQTFSVTQGVYNIAGNLSTSTFATTIAAGAAISGKLTFSIRNEGNLTLPSNQHLNLQIIAISDDDFHTSIGALTNVSTGNWAPGKSANFSLTKSFLAGLTAGTYTFAVTISPIPSLLQQTDDDLLDETAGHASFTITVT